MTRVSRGTLWRTRGWSWERFTRMSLWSVVGNSRVHGTCYAGCGALWNIAGVFAERCGETRSRFADTMDKNCVEILFIAFGKFMRVQKNLGTAGEFLTTPSIEHSGLRGESRFLHEIRRQHSCSQLFNPCVWQTSAWARCSLPCKKSHQACGDGEDQTPPQWCVSAHFSVLLRVLIHPTFGGDHSCAHRQRSHELMHTD